MIKPIVGWFGMLVLTLGVLTACGQGDDRGKATSGDREYTERCIDGVIYLVRKRGYTGYMSVKFNPDSTVVTCEK